MNAKKSRGIEGTKSSIVFQYSLVTLLGLVELESLSSIPAKKPLENYAVRTEFLFDGYLIALLLCILNSCLEQRNRIFLFDGYLISRHPTHHPSDGWMANALTTDFKDFETFQPIS